MRAMMFVLALALALAIGLGVGCGGGGNPYGYEPATSTPANGSEATPNVTPATWDQVIKGDVSGVMPGVFRIGNVRLGDTIDDWPDDNPLLGFVKGDSIGIIIYNAKNIPVLYSVTFALPHDPADGYEAAPPEAARWVIISDSMPIIPARSTLIVCVSIYIPKTAEVPDNWEFAIAISEAQPPANRLKASGVQLLGGSPPAGARDIADFLNSITWENMTDTVTVHGTVSDLTPPTSDSAGADYFVLTSGGRTLEVYFLHALDPQVEELENGCQAVVTGILLRETVVRTEMRVRWLISMR